MTLPEFEEVYASEPFFLSLLTGVQILQNLRPNERWPDPAARARDLLDPDVVTKLSSDSNLDMLSRQLYSDLPAELYAQLLSFHLAQADEAIESHAAFAFSAIDHAEANPDPSLNRVKSSLHYQHMHGKWKKARDKRWSQTIPESITRSVGRPTWIDEIDPGRNLLFPREGPPNMSQHTLESLRNILVRDQLSPRWLGVAIKLVLQERKKKGHYPLTKSALDDARRACCDESHPLWHLVGEKILVERPRTPDIDVSQDAEFHPSKTTSPERLAPSDTPPDGGDKRAATVTTKHAAGTRESPPTPGRLTPGPEHPNEEDDPQMPNWSESEGAEDVRSDDIASLSLMAITKLAQAKRKKAADVRAQYCLTDIQFRGLTLLTESNLETGESKWNNVQIQVCGGRHTAATVLAMEIRMSSKIHGHSVYQQLMCQDIGMWATSALLLGTLELVAVPSRMALEPMDTVKPRTVRKFVQKPPGIIWTPGDILYLPANSISEHTSRGLKEGKEMLIHMAGQVRTAQAPTNLSNLAVLRNPVSRALRRELPWSDGTVQEYVTVLLDEALAKRTGMSGMILNDERCAIENACLASVLRMYHNQDSHSELLHLGAQDEAARSFTLLVGRCAGAE
jgi:hypothetical protein